MSWTYVVVWIIALLATLPLAPSILQAVEQATGKWITAVAVFALSGLFLVAIVSRMKRTGKTAIADLTVPVAAAALVIGSTIIRRHQLKGSTFFSMACWVHSRFAPCPTELRMWGSISVQRFLVESSVPSTKRSNGCSRIGTGTSATSHSIFPAPFSPRSLSRLPCGPHTSDFDQPVRPSFGCRDSRYTNGH